MIIYILKTTLILGILFILYVVLLKGNKSFAWNRKYLLSSSVLALILPLIEGEYWLSNSKVISAKEPIVVTLDTINIYASTIQTREDAYSILLLVIYILGVVWGLVRILHGYRAVKRIQKNANAQKVGNDIVYFSNDIDSPFSFYRQIYIPESMRNLDILDIILRHEHAHITLKHSIDKVYFSILQAFFWFNPFLYQYHREIELIHEFEADEYTTKEIATDTYVENLLKTIQYTQTTNLLAHHFFHHPLKTRITMLYKKSKTALLQKASVILAGIIICCTFLFLQSYGQNKTSKDKYKHRIADGSTDTVYVETATGNIEMKLVQRVSTDSLIYEEVEEMPVFACGKMSLEDFVKDNLMYPAECVTNKVEGKVVIGFIIMKDGFIESYEITQGADERLNRAAVNLINRFPRWTPAKINGVPVSMEMKLPIVFKL